MLVKSFSHDRALTESCLQGEEMFLSLSLFLRKHVSSLAKSSCLKKSPPGCDNTTDSSHVANYVVPSPLKPLTSAVSPQLSDWLFLEQTHTPCAKNAKSGKLQGKEKRKKRGATLCSIIYNMLSFIFYFFTSYFISPWFDSHIKGDEAWSAYTYPETWPVCSPNISS